MTGCDGTCAVAWARPRSPSALVLDGATLERVSRLRRPIDRARHATGVRLSDMLVRAFAGPAATVCRRQGEAPQVEGAAWHVSVTHGGEWVGVAVCNVAPVGMDVEPLDRRDVTGVSALVLSPSELVAFGQLHDGDARTRALLQAWTCKEAVLKATGEGLRVDPRAVEIPPYSAPAAPSLIWHGGQPIRVAKLAPDSTHVAAVAVLTDRCVDVDVLHGDRLLG